MRNPRHATPAAASKDRHQNLKRKAIRAAWRADAKHAVVRAGRTLCLAGSAHQVEQRVGADITAETVVFEAQSAAIARRIVRTFAERVTSDSSPATLLAEVVREVTGG